MRRRCRHQGTLSSFSGCRSSHPLADATTSPSVSTTAKTCSMSAEEPTRDNYDRSHASSTQNVIVPVTLRSQGLHSAEEVGELSGGGEHRSNTSKQHSIDC
jgi:hypothetical protein